MLWVIQTSLHTCLTGAVKDHWFSAEHCIVPVNTNLFLSGRFRSAFFFLKKKDDHIFLCILTAHCSGFSFRSFPYWVTIQWYNFCLKQMKLYRVPFTLLQSRWTRSSQTAPTLPEERLVKRWVDRRHCCHRSWQHQNQQSHSTHTKTLDCWQIPAGPKKVPGTVFKSGSDLWLQFTENTVDGGEGTGDTTRPQLKGFHQLPRCLEGVWGCAAIYRFS